MKRASRGKWVKLLSPSYSGLELKAVERVLRSGWWGLGPETEKFETEFANYVGSKYAICLNSATAALHLAVKSTLSEKGEVIVPAFTFISTALCALYEGHKIVFADIEEESLCLDPKSVKACLSSKTKAVIPVHFAGRKADTKYKDITVIEDCAHGAGVSHLGNIGKVACWSFHPVKNIATGDLGMLTTNDLKIANRVRSLRWFGITMSTFDREKKGYNWEYDVDEIGYKYHGNDVMSAIGRVQLKRLKAMNKKRASVALLYNREFKNLPVKLPIESENWHLYILRVDPALRSKLVDFLRDRKISPGVHYKPLYYFSKVFNTNPKDEVRRLPNTQRAYREVISIPIHPDLTLEEQNKVIKSVKLFFKKHA